MDGVPCKAVLDDPLGLRNTPLMRVKSCLAMQSFAQTLRLIDFQRKKSARTGTQAGEAEQKNAGLKPAKGSATKALPMDLKDFGLQRLSSKR